MKNVVVQSDATLPISSNRKLVLAGSHLVDAIDLLAAEDQEAEKKYRHGVWGRLQRAFGYALTVHSDKAAQKILTERAQGKIKPDFSTVHSTIGLVTKIVFDRPKQSLNDYKLTLIAAHENGVQPNGVAEWIEDKNGIGKILDEIRDREKNAGSPEQESPDDPARPATDTVLKVPGDLKIPSGTLVMLVEVKDGALIIKRHTGKSELLKKVREFFSKEDARSAAEVKARLFAKQKPSRRATLAATQEM